MLIRLFVLFICLPFIELVLLLQLADATSWWVTLAIIIVTGVIGVIAARRDAVAAMKEVREALAEGRMPGREIQDGMMIALAAALLVMPGLLSDAVGFFLLIPLGRRVVGGYLRRRFAGRFQVYTSGFRPPTPPNTDFESESAPWSRLNSGGERFTIDSPSYGPKQGQPH